MIAMRIRALADAKATTARALVEAENSAPIGALPPGSSYE
jgi:hypothetical protein